MIPVDKFIIVVPEEETNEIYVPKGDKQYRKGRIESCGKYTYLVGDGDVILFDTTDACEVEGKFIIKEEKVLAICQSK